MNGFVQAALIVAACTLASAAGCAAANIGFMALNANKRANEAGGWRSAVKSRTFWAGTAVDAGFAALRMKTLQSVRGVKNTSLVTKATISNSRQALATTQGRQILRDNVRIGLGSAGLRSVIGRRFF